MLVITLLLACAEDLGTSCDPCATVEDCEVLGDEGSHCEYGYCCADIGDGSGCSWSDQADADAICAARDSR